MHNQPATSIYPSIWSSLSVLVRLQRLISMMQLVKKAREKLTKAKNENIQQKKICQKKKLEKMLENKVKTGQNTRKKTQSAKHFKMNFSTMTKGKKLKKMQ